MRMDGQLSLGRGQGAPAALLRRIHGAQLPPPSSNPSEVNAFDVLQGDTERQTAGSRSAVCAAGDSGIKQESAGAELHILLARPLQPRVIRLGPGNHCLTQHPSLPSRTARCRRWGTRWCARQRPPLWRRQRRTWTRSWSASPPAPWSCGFAATRLMWSLKRSTRRSGSASASAQETSRSRATVPKTSSPSSNTPTTGTPLSTLGDFLWAASTSASGHGECTPTATIATCATTFDSAWRGFRHMPGTRASPSGWWQEPATSTIWRHSPCATTTPGPCACGRGRTTPLISPR